MYIYTQLLFYILAQFPFHKLIFPICTVTPTNIYLTFKLGNIISNDYNANKYYLPLIKGMREYTTHIQ